jgi:MOSC domain-containing protein YiiM
VAQNALVATLHRIWIKRSKRGPMDAVRSVIAAPGGLDGNANQGGRRQVTIIAAERWAELMRDLGADVPPSARRANLMISGLDLENTRGRILRVGSVRLQINGETRPCERMEEACPGLQALMRDRWGGGVFADILDEGEIRVGDAVAWERVE